MPYLEKIAIAVENCISGFQQLPYPLDKTPSIAVTDWDNVDGVDPGSLSSGMRSLLDNMYATSAHIWKCCAEVEYGSGVLLLKPVG